MKVLFSLPVLAVALLSPLAQASNLLPYLVFSRSSIESQHSDYQGNTGAVGQINLSNFEIRGALYSGQGIRMTDGSVHGLSRAPRISTTRASLRRGSYDANVANHLNAASQEMGDLAVRLSSYPATASAETVLANQRGSSVNALKFTATRPLEVIDVDAATVSAYSALVFEGNGSSLLLVRVRGSVANLSNKATIVTRGITPAQIVLYFPEASSVDISYSGGAVDPATGTHWGIPGAILAPNAAVHFAEVLVTGEVYVGQLCTQLGLNGGQVNFSQSILLNNANVGGGCPPQPRCNACCR